MMNIQYKEPTQLNSQSGLTLIELMVATVILAILASAAAPTMKSLFERNTISSSGDFFVKSIKLARLEAIQRGRTVDVIPTSGTSDWSQGWSIIADDDGGTPQTIRDFPALSGNPVFSSTVYGNGQTLSILPTGQVSVLGSFELFYSDCTGQNKYTFNVLLSGLIQRGISSC